MTRRKKVLLGSTALAALLLFGATAPIFGEALLILGYETWLCMEAEDSIDPCLAKMEEVRLWTGEWREPPPRVQRCSRLDDFFADAIGGCFTWIPGGSFTMGAQAEDPAQPGYDPRAQPDEGPPREVRVDGFWVQPMEVQVRQYRGCVDAFVCREPEPADGGFVYTGEQWSTGSVRGLTWSEAQTFCGFLGGRLPTEAEWEYLARGEDGLRFPWGDEVRCADTRLDVLDQEAVAERLEGDDEAFWDAIDCSLDRPPSSKARHAIELDGEKLVRTVVRHDTRGAFALYHLDGSLWEWVGDYYDPDYYQRGVGDNPTGPSEGAWRVQRGGGWMSSSVWEYRAAGRASMDPDLRMPDAGFRCVIPED